MARRRRWLAATKMEWRAAPLCIQRIPRTPEAGIIFIHNGAAAGAGSAPKLDSGFANGRQEDVRKNSLTARRLCSTFVPNASKRLRRAGLIKAAQFNQEQLA
jgi:hypothetical protein